MEAVKRGLKQNGDSRKFIDRARNARIIFEADFLGRKGLLNRREGSHNIADPKVLFYERGISAGLSRENRRKVSGKYSFFSFAFDRFKKKTGGSVILSELKNLACFTARSTQKLFFTHSHMRK